MRSELLSLCGAILLTAAPARSEELKQQVDAYRAAHEAAIVADLEKLVRFKSIAASPNGTAAAGAELERMLKQRGFKTALLSAGPGTPPVVFGSLATGAKRTVVFYAHYDGQPVTPSQWTSDPFVPVVRTALAGPNAKIVDWKNAKAPFDPEWRLFGRAVADDKASEVAFLAAFDALQAIHRKPSVNIKVVWEGEEEAGSPHLAEILRSNVDKLGSDLWLIGDGPVHQSRRQSLYFGARGTTAVELTIYGPRHALHDGHYGNWVPNPAAMAANLIAQMRDDEGRILIPGFSTDVRQPTSEEKNAIAALPPIENQLKSEFAIGRTEGSDSAFASLLRPALNIRGFRSGQVGAEAANAIPVDAEISIDFRLVPDQTPEKVRANFEGFLRARGWTIVTQDPDQALRLAHPRLIKLAWETGYPAMRSDMNSAAARAVINAAGKAADQPIAIVPTVGGSVPLYIFSDIFKAPVIVLPIANHDDNQHAADENLRLRNLWNGIDTYAALMAELDW